MFNIQDILDNLLLKICNPFKKIANNILEKRNNPDAYERKQVIRDIGMVIRILMKKRIKGKALNKRETEIVMSLKLALTMISTMDNQFNTDFLSHYLDILVPSNDNSNNIINLLTKLSV